MLTYKLLIALTAIYITDIQRKLLNAFCWYWLEMRDTVTAL